MRKLVGLALAIGVISSVATTSFAAEATDKTVKARRAYFQVVLSNAAPLFGMLKGKVAYDSAKAQTFANNLKLLIEMKNGHLWTKGSDNGNPELKGQTRALPTIWEAGSDAGALSKSWKEAVVALAAEAGNGKEAMAARMKIVGEACSACHKKHRAKDF
ncbi:MAG: c-type cytochrome [Hyphomicrobiaceae bacterium]